MFLLQNGYQKLFATPTRRKSRYSKLVSLHKRNGNKRNQLLYKPQLLIKKMGIYGRL